MVLRKCAALLVCAAFSCVAVGTIASAVRAKSPLSSQTPTALSPVTVGRTTVAWNSANGLSIAVDGVPVVRKSTLYLVKPGYTGEVLYQTTAKPTVSGWEAKSNGTQTATVTLENENAVGTYTFTVGPQDAVDVNLAYRLKKDIPAEIEYAAGYLSGMVLQGSTQSGPDGSEVPLVQIPVAPPAKGRSQVENRLAPPFDEVRYATRLGLLTVTYSGTAPKPVIFDARSEAQEWAQEFPVFWMGIGSPQQPVSFADGEKNAHFHFSIGPRKGVTTVEIAEMKGVISRRPVQKDAFTPYLPPTPLIIPRPKQATFPTEAGLFRLTPQTKIALTSNSPMVSNAARILQRAIEEQFGFKPEIVTAGAKNATPLKQAIRVGVTPAAAPDKPEGYAVTAGANGVTISGRDDAGALWGVQTAVQLLAADTSGPLIRPAAIRDWPTLAVRGVHLFHGKNALPFHEKLIDRVFSRFKMNTLVIQAEQVRWDADPEVAPIWAGTKADLKTEIEFARERGIRTIPLVQSYGHMEWLFNKPQNHDYAEDPDKPYAVNFTDPKAVAYLEKFNAEADDLFAAPVFHIGLDEVTMLGRFPYRSKPRAFPDLFVTAATHWNEFFKKRGKEVWMWADMALHPDEVKPSIGTAPSAADAAKVRAGLPKDIVMVDWQYGGQDRYPSLQTLKNAGFKKIIAATWYRADNIQNFSRAAAQAGILGALQTTWAGFESKEDVLSSPERRQFVAMVLAADYFWNGGAGPSADRLPYDAETVFARQMAGPDPAAMHPRAGYALNLSEVTNEPLVSGFGYGSLAAPANLPPGPLRTTDGTSYFIDPSALVLAARLNPGTGGFPGICEVPVPVDAALPAQEARILLAATHRTTPGTKLGTVQVKYSGGQTAEIPLIYGQNIASWEDERTAPDTPTVFRAQTRSGQPFLLRRLVVVAPEGKTIESLRFVSAFAESAPVVLAITVLPK